MTEQFTPGPWTYEHDGAGSYRILAKQGPLDVSPATANGLTDARLIAAAPDLLEALKGCQSLLKTQLHKLIKHDDPEIGKQMFLRFCQSVDDAITKAITGA